MNNPIPKTDNQCYDGGMRTIIRNNINVLGFILLCALIATDNTNAQDATKKVYGYSQTVVANLEGELAELILQSRSAKGRVGKVLSGAALNYRLITIELLKKGLENPDTGTSALYYAHLLHNRMPDFDALLHNVKTETIRLADPKISVTQNEVQRTADTIEALEAFNKSQENDATRLGNGNPTQVDLYLRNRLSALQNVVHNWEGSTPQTTWVTPPDDESDLIAIDPEVFTQENLGKLIQRIKSAELLADTRRSLVEMVETLGMQLQNDSTKELSSALLGLTVTGLDVLDTIEQSKWLGEKVQQEMREKMQVSFQLLRDDRTRQMGIVRIQKISDRLYLVDRLNAVAEFEPLVGHLRDTYRVSQEIVDNDAQTSQTIMQYLSELVDLIVTHEHLKSDLQGEIGRVSRLLEQDYVKTKNELIAQLPLIEKNPKSIHDLKWREEKKTLQLVADDVDRINTLPLMIEMMEKMGGKPAGGVQRRVMILARQMLNPKTINHAARELARLEEEFFNFHLMPNETELRTANSIYADIVGNQQMKIITQLERLRALWTTGWATGRHDPKVTFALQQLRRLLVKLNQSQSLEQMNERLNLLNRWAGWDTPQTVTKALVQQSTWSIKQAAKFAADGNFDALEAALNDNDTTLAVPDLTNQLYLTLRTDLTTFKQGVSGLVNQTQFNPTISSVAMKSRTRLNELCVLLHESAAATQKNDHAAAEQWLIRSNNIATQILEQLDHPDK